MAAPSLGTFWGIGTRFVGQRDRRVDGSYVTTVWLCIFYIPIIPGSSHRVIEGKTSMLWVPGVFHHSSTSYLILGDEPTSGRHILRVYGVLAIIASILIWANSEKWLTIVDAETEIEWNKALLNFEPFKKGALKGRFAYYNENGQVKDQDLLSKGRSVLEWRSTSHIPKWIPAPWDTAKAYQQWQLRAKAGCAMVCQALTSCVGFYVLTSHANRNPYISCNTLTAVQAVDSGGAYASWDAPPMYTVRKTP